MARLRNVTILLALLVAASMIGPLAESSSQVTPPFPEVAKPGELLCYRLNIENYPVYNGHGIIFHGEDGVDRVVCWDNGPFAREPKDHA